MFHNNNNNNNKGFIGKSSQGSFELLITSSCVLLGGVVLLQSSDLALEQKYFGRLKADIDADVLLCVGSPQCETATAPKCVPKVESLER